METKQITSEVSCSYEVSGDKYSEWFNLDVDTLLTDLNNIAAQKEYPALWKLYPDGPYGKGMLTRDGDLGLCSPNFMMIVSSRKFC